MMISMPAAVLICDDDPESRSALRQSLAGFSIEEAESALAGRAALEARTFDAIIAASLDVLQFARVTAPATFRVLVSSEELEVVVQAVNQGCAHRFFQKPWDAEKLRATLDQVLRARGAGV